MIQRIQSIFLLLAGAGSLSLPAVDFATVDQDIPSSALFADAQYDVFDSLGLLIPFPLAGAMAIIAIFMYRHRKNQLLLSRLAFVTNLVGIILAVVFYMRDAVYQGSVVPEDGVGLYLPIAGLVLLGLAMRYITKDEKLVRSSDRLR